jgi:hypothetical protein
MEHKPQGEKTIAGRDKELMRLQQQIELKEAQIKEDYRRLQRDVKKNPYLQVALEEYKAYFEREKLEKDKKIKALSKLLQHMQEEEDRLDIKREIIRIKRK